MGTKHLIIGDAHSKPNQDLSRFDWLGKLVLDEKPDTIIDMGDWEDMESLSSYDMGKKSYEGRRYRRDLEAAYEARERFNAPLRDFNDNARRHKKALYQPSLVSLGCNHFEKRVKRTIELSPLLEGTISVEDNRVKDYGWTYIPFLEPVTIDGFTYSHYFQGNGTANPIAMGEFPAQTLLRKKHTSCVMGHNHLLDVATDITGDERRIWTFSAGCYFTHHEEYAGRNNKRWWRGILILDDVKDGDIGGYRTISLKTIEEKYGAT